MKLQRIPLDGKFSRWAFGYIDFAGSTFDGFGSGTHFQGKIYGYSLRVMNYLQSNYKRNVTWQSRFIIDHAIRYELSHKYFQYWSRETQNYAKGRLIRSYFGLSLNY